MQLDANGFNFAAGFETLSAGATCTVSVDIRGTSPGDHDNSVELLAEFVSAGFAVGTLNVRAPGQLHLTKSFVTDPAQAGGTATLRFKIENFARSGDATDVAFTDDLTAFTPALAGVTYDSLLFNDCGGTVGGTGTGLITFAGGVIASGVTCTIDVSLAIPAGAASGTHTNTTSNITGTIDGSGVTGDPASDSFTVQAVDAIPPTLQMNMTDGVTNGTIDVEFTITNNATVASTAVAFTDTFNNGFPSTTASSVPANGSCGAGSTISFTPGFNPPAPSDATPARFDLTGGTLAAAGSAGDSCSFTLTLNILPDASGGTYANMTSDITATQNGMSVSGPGASASTTINSDVNVEFVKEFDAASAAGGSSVGMIFTITNTAESVGPASAITFTDDLAAFVPGATLSGLPMSDVCGAGSTLTGSVGDTVLTLTGGTLARDSQCIINVDVNIPLGAPTGTRTNTTEALDYMAGGAPASAGVASASVTVYGGGVFESSIEFIDDPILAGESATLRIAFDNSAGLSNITNLSTSFNIADILPGTPDFTGGASLTDPCGTGSSLTKIGASFFVLSGGNLAPGASCFFDIVLTAPAGATSSTYNFSTSVISADFDASPVTLPGMSDAVVIENAILLFSKAFPNSPAVAGTTTQVEYTLQNTGTAAVSDLAFSTDFAAMSGPTAGTIDGATPGALPGAVTTDTCGGGATSASFANPFTYAGGTLNAGETCTVVLDIDITALTQPDTYLSMSSGLAGTSGGIPVTGDAPSASLRVVSPTGLGFAKSFSGDLLMDETVVLTFSLTNPGSATVTGLAFTDDLEAVVSGLTASSLPANPCGGSLTGPSLLAFSGGTLAAGETCEFDVTLTLPFGSAAGSFSNETSDLLVSGLSVAPAATAPLTVLDREADLTTTVSDSADPLFPGDALTYSVTVTNAGPVPADGAQATLTLPAGVTLVSTSGCAEDPTGAPTCSLGTIASGSSAAYSVTVNVDDATTGVITANVTAGPSAGSRFVDPDAGNTDSSETTTITPLADVSILKGDSLTSVVAGETLTYTIAAQNAGPSANPNVSLTDTLPAGLSCTYTSAASGGLTGNTAAGAGDLAETLAMPAASSVVYTMLCTVDSAATGVLDNTATVASGGGAPVLDPTPGNNSARDNNTVITTEADLSITKTDGLTNVAAGAPLSYTIVATNAGPSDDPNVSVADSFPASLNTCGFTSVAAGGATGNTAASSGDIADTLSMPAGASVTYTASCDVDIAATGTLSNTATLTGSVTDPDTGNNTATDGDTAITPPVAMGFVKSFAPSTVDQGLTSVLTLSLDNAANSVAATGVAFTDTFPSGLEVAPAPATTNTCGGTFAPAAGDISLAFSGGTVPASGSCAVSVTVRAIGNADLPNTTSALTSNFPADSAPASATLGVTPAVAPGFAKAFVPATVEEGETSVLTFTIDNSANSIAADGLTFTDSFPVGMVVAPTPALSNSCGGAISPTPGDSTLSFSGGSVAALGSCTIAVTVRALADGSLPNSSGDLTSSLPTATGAAATLSVTPAPAPGFAKGFAPATIGQGEISTLTFTIDNSANAIEANTLVLGDTFPAGMVVAPTPAAANTCGGSFAPAAGDNAISLTGGTVAQGATCTVSVDVRALNAGALNNTSDDLTSSIATATAAAATLTVNPAAAPGFAKAFAPATIEHGQTSVLTFTIDNSANAIEAASLAFGDTFPAGMVVAPVPGATSSCGGTVVANPGDASISFSGGTVAQAASCTVAITVRALQTGALINTSDDLTSSIATATGAGATLTVDPAAPPGFAKGFAPSTVDQGGFSTLTFTIDNSANAIEADALAFTDNLPAGMIVAAEPGATNSCGGTFAPVADATLVSLTGGNLAEGASCTLSVLVRALVPGTLINTSDDLTSSLATAAGASAPLNINSAGAPGFTKVFAPASIVQGETSVLTFTIDNTANAIEADTLAFTDPFPGDMVVAPTPGDTNGCGGTFAPAAGDSTLSFSGGTVAAGDSCTLSVTVRATAVATLTNLSSSLTSTLTTGTAATADLDVTPATPLFTKAFSPDTIDQGETSTLTFTIDNSGNAIMADRLGFTDPFPAGMEVAAVPAASNTCSGVFNPAAGDTSVTLSGGNVAEAASCTLSVTVRATGFGTLSNTAGDLISTQETAAGPSADLTVNAAVPVFAKAFSPATITQGETSTLSFTIDNTANAIEADALAFLDTFPAGMEVAATPSAANTCGGTFAPVAGDGSVTLSGGNVAAGASCTLSVSVRATGFGTLGNLTDDLTSSLTTVPGAAADLTVSQAAAPAFSKSFAPATIGQGETSTLSFSIDNAANAIDIDTLAFTDAFPAGMEVAPTPNFTNTCGGTFAGSGDDLSVTLTGGTLAAGAACTLSVDVRALLAGVLPNLAGDLTSSAQAADGAAADLSVTAADGPAFGKAFTPDTVDQGQTTVLSFDIDNSANAIEAAAMAFTDVFPAGMEVAAAPGLSNSCGGTFSPAAGDTSVSLSDATLAAGATCSLSVTLRATGAGVLPNEAGTLTSTLQDSAGATADLTVNAAAAPGFAKAFAPDTINQGETTVLTFDIDNSANAIEAATLAFVDNFPAGLIVAGTPDATNTCGGTFAPAADDTTVQLDAGLLAAGATCSLSVRVRALQSGTIANVTEDLTSTIATATGASADLSVNPAVAPGFTKAFAPDTVDQGETSVLTFTIDNTANALEADDILFLDPLPTGLIVAGTPNVSNSCTGGVTTANPGDGSIQYSGGRAEAGSTCQISVTVQAIGNGALDNVTSALTSLFDDADPATATLNVNAVPMALGMSFAPATIEQLQVSTLTYTLTNSATIAANAVEITDTLPANLTIASLPNATTTCVGGTLLAPAGGGQFRYTGGTVPAASSCQISVDVTSAVVGTYPNSTETQTSSLGSSAAASASLQVEPGTTGAVTFVVNSDTDGSFGFSSSEPSLTFAIAVAGGTGSAGPVNLLAGSYSVSAAAPGGIVLTAISCNDTDSSGDATTGVLTLNLAALEVTTCTITAQSSVQKTVDTINRFLTKRADLILSSEPDAGRRINRLKRGSGNASPLSFANGDLKALLPFTAEVGRSTGSYRFSTSLLQAREAAASLQLAHGATRNAIYVDNYRFDAWFEAQYKKFDAGAQGEGHFAVAYLGADYLLSPDLLVGLMLQIDDMEDVSAALNTSASGTGWMVGPYMTARLAPNLYFDARLAGGASTNQVSPFNTYTDSFSTDRWLAKASLTGEFQRGPWTIQPNASLSYFQETQGSYVDSVGATIPSQTIELGQLQFGPTFTGRFEGDDGQIYSPYFSVDAIYNLGQTSGATVTNAATPSTDGWRGRLKAGINMTTESGVSIGFGGTYDGIGRDDFNVWGLSFELTIPLSKPIAQ
ncbi:MAG: DUF11 domain-containing protein [Rhodobacter sp.]|nr:DUF11 domain-containing protein [Rhodobacter sp.]